MPLIIINGIFCSLFECLIISLLLNILRIFVFKNGFHAPTLEKCIKITIVYISLLSIISHNICNIFELNTIFICLIASFIGVYIMDCTIGKKFFTYIAKFL